MRTASIVGAALVGAALVAGCNDGSGLDGVAPGSGTVDVLIGDATVDDLLAFSARVDELRLVRTSGAPTANLLASPTTLELVGLAGPRAWLASASVPQGTYDSVLVGFVAGSYEALAGDGDEVAVTALGHELELPLTPALVVGNGGRVRIDVDVDLALALSGSVSTPPITFDPAGTATVLAGSIVPLDELRGIVASVDAVQGRFVIDAYVDDDLALALGPVAVVVEALALLFDETGAAYADADAFFAALQPGASAVTVHGSIAGDSTLVAGRVDVDDHAGGAPSVAVVEIEGVVIGTGAGTFDLLVREVEKAADVAGEVLAGLGDPAAIEVAVDGSTVVLADGAMASAAALAIGQEVEVRFAAFAAPPFPAALVAIEEESVGARAVVADIAGLPTSVVVNLHPFDPQVLAGSVASGATDVTVDLTSSDLFLGVESEPTLAPAQLVAGLELVVDGTWSGTANAPTLAATWSRVEPGRFDGRVTSVSAQFGTFDTNVGTISDPFGGAVTGGPLTVVLGDPTAYSGDVASAQGLYAAFLGLFADEVLEVRVEGIGTATPNEVLGYRVQALVFDTNP